MLKIASYLIYLCVSARRQGSQKYSSPVSSIPKSARETNLHQPALQSLPRFLDQYAKEFCLSGDHPTSTEKKNKGKLIVDATVAPSNIKYPTDLDLLNDSREISEYLIDTLYSSGQFSQKPRTYRRLARRDYLRIIKKKLKSKKVIRLGIRQQLQYLRRNLSHIDSMFVALKDQPEALSRKELERLEVVRTIFRQQEEMYLNGVHTVKDRIVSIHQPQIRPMVRGKANSDVEFGPKLSLSVVDGFLYLDHLRCLPACQAGNSFNESLDLIAQVNKYRKRFGHFPKVVIADNIYGTRENRGYLKENRIRFSGKKLGRPPMEIDAVTREMERLRVLEQGERNEVEGKIGTAKTRYGLGKVMTKTELTSDNWVAMAIFSMNMATALRLSAIQAGRLLLSLFYWVKNWLKFVTKPSFLNCKSTIISLVSE